MLVLISCASRQFPLMMLPLELSPLLFSYRACFVVRTVDKDVVPGSNPTTKHPGPRLAECF